MTPTAEGDVVRHQQDAEVEIASGFAEIEQLLASADDLDERLARVSQLAVSLMEGCEHAAITLMEGNQPWNTRGATDPIPELIDRLQYDTGQGPCLDAIRLDDIVRVDDLRRDDRWPKFAPLAVERTGIRSMLSYRLFVRSDTIGALNLYSKHPNAFISPRQAVELGEIIATHAAVVLSGRRLIQQLESAMASRDTISMGMDLFMGRQGLSREQAFDVLRRASQRTNVKVRDIAEQIVGGKLDLEGLQRNFEGPADGN
jgi:GAF domain-containing protein